jgi:hypothetical protein
MNRWTALCLLLILVFVPVVLAATKIKDWSNINAALKGSGMALGFLAYFAAVGHLLAIVFA